MRRWAALGAPATPGLGKAPGSSPPPLPGRRLVLLLLLLELVLDGAAAAFSELGTGKCGVPWQVPNAHIDPENSSSRRLRYVCLKNFKRKAGKSNLIVCEQDPTTREYRWSPPVLVCISLGNTADGSIRETARPTQTPVRTNPVSTSARLYGSQTDSPVVVETSRLTNAPHRTAEPTPNSLGSTGTATPEGGRLTPGTISESVTPSPRTTPFPPDETSKSQWTPRLTTSAPSEETPGNTTDPSDTSVSQNLTGSVYVGTGITLLVVILSARFMYYCYCRRSRHAWRQHRIPSVEGIAMDPMGSEEGRPASASHSPDPGLVNEDDPMLTGLPPPVE